MIVIEPEMGFEPMAFSLPRKRSTPELRGLNLFKNMRPMLFSVAIGAQYFTLFNLRQQTLEANFPLRYAANCKIFLHAWRMMKSQRRRMGFAASGALLSFFVRNQPLSSFFRCAPVFFGLLRQ